MPAQGTNQPVFAPSVVLVRFKQTQGGVTAAAAQANRPLPGLSLQQLVGEHMATPVDGVNAAAGPSKPLPADAVMLMRITDGMSVEAKVAQLRANPGGC